MKGKTISLEEYCNRVREGYIINWRYDLNYAERELKDLLQTVENEQCEYHKGTYALIEQCEKRIARCLEALKESNIEQYVRSQQYHYKKTFPHKDNEGAVVPYDVSRSSKIRVPKLKRKNAWKKFYKKYPALKGMKSICGNSESAGCRKLNKSLIKLKRIK